MNLPLQMGAVLRGRPALSSMSRRSFASGQVLPASNYCGKDYTMHPPRWSKTCRCASNFQEYKCVGPDDDCADCGASGNQT